MKKTLRTIFTMFFFGLFFGTANAKGMPFTEQVWKEAQAQGQIILVDISADWCPTCKAQEKILNAYFSENPNSKIKQLSVNFDTQKEWVTYFKAPRQSTLLIYQGEQQKWFSVAETHKEKIFNVLKDAEGMM